MMSMMMYNVKHDDDDDDDDEYRSSVYHEEAAVIRGTSCQRLVRIVRPLEEIRMQLEMSAQSQ